MVFRVGSSHFQSNPVCCSQVSRLSYLFVSLVESLTFRAFVVFCFPARLIFYQISTEIFFQFACYFWFLSRFQILCSDIIPVADTTYCE